MNEKANNTEQKALSIEESFLAIDEVLDKLNDEEVSLEESFLLYEKGMKLLLGANDKLGEMEARVEKINSEGSLEDFNYEE